jgi:hypothetical protein
MTSARPHQHRHSPTHSPSQPLSFLSLS